jgi:hypothetical protein
MLCDVVGEDAVLGDVVEPLDRRALLVAVAAHDRDVEAVDGRGRVARRHDLVRAVAVPALGGKLHTRGHRLPVGAGVVDLGHFVVAHGAVHVFQVILVGPVFEAVQIGVAVDALQPFLAVDGLQIFLVVQMERNHPGADVLGQFLVIVAFQAILGTLGPDGLGHPRHKQSQYQGQEKGGTGGAGDGSGWYGHQQCSQVAGSTGSR